MMETGAESGKTRPEEVAAYIAAMSAEMGRMARKHNLGALSYLLDLARREAVEQAGGGPPAGKRRIA